MYVYDGNEDRVGFRWRVGQKLVVMVVVLTGERTER